MGNCTVGKAIVMKVKNKRCADATDSHELSGDVHVLICGLDYACDRVSWAGPPPAGNGPLDTKYAFDAMVDLAQKSSVASLKTLWNQECTIQGVANAIGEIASRAESQDYFVFYYTGHGDQLPGDEDEEGERDEEEDQCFCLVGPNGNTDDQSMTYRSQVWMRDDDFANYVIESVGSKSTKVLVLADCCHSGSICDFGDDSEWATRLQPAISISGCEDTQTSAGTGKGGRFTRAMLKAIQEIRTEQAEDDEEDSFMVSDVYNKTLEWYQKEKSKDHTQNINCHGCLLHPYQMAWPLQPPIGYVAKIP